MNAKNLPLKFGLVALMVAVAIWSLYSNGLRWGIDVRGGNSLTFEIGENLPEIRKLEARIAQAQEDLSQAQDEDRKNSLRESIARDKHSLAGYQAEAGDTNDLVERMIVTIKRRLDPEGLSALEIRPLGANRFEIRMPAGKKGSQDAKYAYMQALDGLDKGNIRRAGIRGVLRASSEQRPAEIARIAGQDAVLRQNLAVLAESYDQMTTAQEALLRLRAEYDKLPKTSAEPTGRQAELKMQVQKAQAAFDDLRIAYDERIIQVQGSNIPPLELQNALNNYVSQKVAAAGKKNPDEIARRKNAFETGLAKLRAEHPSRATEIDQVAELYKKWMELRTPLDDPSDLVRLIRKAGVLEFRIAPYSPTSGQDGAMDANTYLQYVHNLRKEGPEGAKRRNDPYLWFPVRRDRTDYRNVVAMDYQGKSYVLLGNQPGSTMLHQFGAGKWSLKKARSITDNRTGTPAVGFDFDEAGAKLFYALTSAKKGKLLTVLLDDEVYSIAIIQSAISKSGQISGKFSQQEVADLVSILEAGSLPGKLNPDPVAQSTFGPTLGEENKQKGFRAAYWGLITVAAFMLLYYLLAGAIANAALLLNIILVLGMMSMLNAVFTLPGIAGVILTIGIAVDANVLIFERLREEQAKGQTIRMALKNAYQRAFSAIMDANITTLIVCMILAWLGTEEVKGFAITLGLGVMFSMFTALVVTRWIFQALLDTRILKKPLPMLRLIGTPGINWMSKRYFFWSLSAAFVVIGAASLVWQGKNIWGIDFTSGTQAILKFNDDALVRNPKTSQTELPADGLIRESFISQAREKGYQKIVDTARVEKVIDHNRIPTFLQDHGFAAGVDITPAQWELAKLDAECFRRLDANGDGAISQAELEDRLPQNSYRIATTETQVSRIREVAAAAFGPALQMRTPSSFRLVSDENIRELGPAINAAGDGATKITAPLIQHVTVEFADDLAEFQGGVLFVLRDVTPAMSRAELVQRIREMRFQPDYSGQSTHKTAVLALAKAAASDGLTDLAVCVLPSDPAVADRSGAWTSFARNELKLIRDAFAREGTMETANFDAAIASQTATRAIFAVVLSWVAIIAYLWFRFGSVRWGLAAVVCLIHDTVIVVGLVAVSGWLHATFIGEFLGIDSFKIDLVMIAALLTVIGYSVNDTIVVFDRIRENRGKLATVSDMVINTSINQTLSRTLLTSGTTFIVVFVMYVWGGPSIHSFNYALLSGIIFGTYSSIAVAAPLLMGFRRAILGGAASAVKAN